jgi:hypothetical protein
MGELFFLTHEGQRILLGPAEGFDGQYGRRQLPRCAVETCNTTCIDDQRWPSLACALKLSPAL